MDVNLCEDEIYQRPWGKHKNGFFKLIYNSGSYGIMQKIKDGKVVEEKSVLVVTKSGDYNDERYAKENNFTKVEEK